MKTGAPSEALGWAAAVPAHTVQRSVIPRADVVRQRMRSSVQCWMWPSSPEREVGSAGRSGFLRVRGGLTERCVVAVTLDVSVGRHPLPRSEEHTSELQSRENLVCRRLL